jgi:peptide methionine sulfoxide reductase MsrB
MQCRKLSKNKTEKRKEYIKQYYQDNKEKQYAYVKQWRKENPEKYKAQQKRQTENNFEARHKNARKWAINNPKKVKENLSRSKKKHKDRVQYETSKRRTNKLLRTPSWFSEIDEFTIREAHSLSVERRELTGMLWHVDHIVPLQGKTVSGLHCFNNVQVIPAKLNLIKSNTF